MYFYLHIFVKYILTFVHVGISEFSNKMIRIYKTFKSIIIMYIDYMWFFY